MDTFSIDMHNMFTDEKRQLKLSDIAGLPIGHVPKCLSSVFRHDLDEGGEIHAEVTGEPVPSFAPWPEPQSEGGGVVLPCNYIISKTNITVLHDKLFNLLKGLKEGSCMELVKV